jgi:pimeloyl-ACP methyl ester carboxylesterase
MAFAEVNGIKLYYEVHGEGEPLILANGIFMNTASWFGQTPVFSKRYQVILYDMRGQGQSDKPDGDYSFEIHTEDQKGLLDHLGIEKVHHLGISYGAELGLEFALKYPQMLKTLVLSSCVSEIGPLLDKIGNLWRYACVNNDPELFFHSTVPFNFSESFIAKNTEFFEVAIERYKLLDLLPFVKLLDAFQKLNVTERLSEIRIPTLIIAGKEDLLKPPDPYSKLINTSINNSELIIIPDAGHAVTHEKPEEFNSSVLNFLKKYEKLKW